MTRIIALYSLVLSLALLASGCASVPNQPATQQQSQIETPSNQDVSSSQGVTSDRETIIVAAPLPEPPVIVAISAPPAPAAEPPIIEIFEQPKWYDKITHWQGADVRPALTSFKRSCQSFAKADLFSELNANLPEYGRYDDWQPACDESRFIPDDANSARLFFETHFEPTLISTEETESGLLTGYYEPEISVRRVPDAVYYEPILAKPTDETTLKLPRQNITASSSRVIAYGKPIDVFFMQVQGSGRIQFDDGVALRAAYAGNNGHKYASIGKVLVERGEMSLEQASKQAISDWMDRSGADATRDLMNENPRYIFFTEQAITFGEGPRGAMRVPLTDMGSIAVDNRYHPYGSLIWLETTLPQFGGDFRGLETGLLVSAQDTGSAIKGPLRGDLFFGSGDEPGDRAGVMKHPVKWTILVPKALAARLRTTS